MEETEISDILDLEFRPNSIRMPQMIKNMLKEDAKNNGRTLSRHLTVILAEKFLREKK